jgi:hypothetical protein
MATYLAWRIMIGKLDYVAVFSISLYLQFKERVDEILIAEGHQDLIKPIT